MRAIMTTKRKVAVVTGASRGIGARLVEGFRQIGYGVVANSRAISQAGMPRDPDILLVDGDIATSETAERIVSAAIDHFGRIDTLVNNAGIFIPKPFVDYSEADFTAMVAVNLAGFFHISQKVISQMLRAGSGHVINVVSPGATKTPMHTPETHDFLAGLQPMGRMGETQEILDAVLYLEKAVFVTGEILHVDGGASAGRW
jgi:NAD(P)-dependent dehydrogenase (short-subunit alcohol dehydrogenase family)